MGVSYSVPYQPSPNQPSPHQVNPHQPSFEEILTESLKPFDLKNAETCRHFLQSLLIEFKSNKDLKQTLGLRSASIESSMIPFLQKLESLSTKEKRREWFRSTYYRKSDPVAMKAENDKLKKDLKLCQSQAKDFKSETDVMIDSIQIENSRLNNVVKERDREIEDLKKRMKEKNQLQQDGKVKEQLLKAEALNSKMSKELQQLRDSLKVKDDNTRQLQMELEQRRGDNRTLRKQLNEVTDRLAAEMNSKVGRDEGALENIGIKNRPMKVAEEYQLFLSNYWLEAKEKLDNSKVPNETALKTLVSIMEEAEFEAFRRHQDVQNSIYHAISKQGESGPTPLDFSSVNMKSKVDTIAVKRIPDGLKNGIGDFLRITADTANVSVIVEGIMAGKLKSKANASIKRNCRAIRGCENFSIEVFKLEKYLATCARLAWKMAIQRPPMSFDSDTGKGEKWKGEKYQDVYFGSDNPTKPGNVVKFYVHPALKHGDTLMTKGRVYIAHQ